MHEVYRRRGKIFRGGKRREKPFEFSVRGAKGSKRTCNWRKKARSSSLVAGGGMKNGKKREK